MLRTRLPRALALLFVWVCCGLGSAAALAQSETGEIVITVTDVTTKKPVASARTILLGPQTASALTTASGVVQYLDVPSGIYRVRVLRSGYAPGISAEFDVLSDRFVAVDVLLAPGGRGLRVIGTVQAKSTVAVSSSDISADSPIRRLSDSLTAALDTLAGVSVTQDTTDPNSPVTISLANHDESQTEVTLDGIPLSAPGSAADLGAIGTDLFTSSSVSFSPRARALGGSVNFNALEPTEALQAIANGELGTFDRSNEQVAATGSVGGLGIAIEQSWRGANSPLTFRDYEDASGLDYVHGGESSNLGDLVKIRDRLGDERTVVSATALVNNRKDSSICAQDVTILPCGIGPDNFNFGRFGFADVNLQSLVGVVATSFAAYETANTQVTNEGNRYTLAPSDPTDPFAAYEETLSPFLGSNTSLTKGIAYSAQIAAGKSTISLSGNTFDSRMSSTPLVGAEFEVPFTNGVSSTSYQLADAIASNDHITLQPHASLVSTSGVGTGILGGFGAGWRPSANDTFSGSVDVGSSQPPHGMNRSFSSPVGAQIDCASGTAVVSGPGDAGGGPQSSTSLSLGWTHAFPRGSLSLSTYSQLQTGQTISAEIEEPDSYFPAGYLAQLESVFASPAVCGGGAVPSRVFVNETVAGTRRLYQGVMASGRYGIGRDLVILPTYSLGVAELTGASSRLKDGPTTTIVGAQLPGRPLHRAGLTVDGYLERSATELLATVQYTGANNQQNLGPYATVSAGIAHGLGPGRLTVFENNMFNTYGGVFATNLYAVPVPLSDGSSIVLPARPLLPRSIYAQYSLAFGGPRPGPAIAAVGGGPSRAPAGGTTPTPR
ncbi:MAG: hypothetical protein ACREM2_07930, partial [Vulcanimicrobiaceae bacterium]